MLLTKKIILSSLLAFLALAGLLVLSAVQAPVAEAGPLTPTEPCTALNVGATFTVSAGYCSQVTPAWITYTCTQRADRFFWAQGELQCGDTISPSFP